MLIYKRLKIMIYGMQLMICNMNVISFSDYIFQKQIFKIKISPTRMIKNFVLSQHSN